MSPDNFALDCELFGPPPSHDEACRPGAVLRALWSPGWHSLNSKRGDEKFRVHGFFDDPAVLIAHAANLSDRNVWFGVHGMAERPSKRGGSEDVTSVVALVADVDWNHPAHKATGLPSEQEVRQRLRRLGDELTPGIVIASGHGLQLYWLLDHDVGAQQGGELQARLDARLGQLDLKNERTDLASILRLPGSWNHKAEPKRVIVEHAVLERRYVPEYLDRRLPRATRRPRLAGTRHHGAGPATEAQRRLAAHVMERHGGHSLVETGGGTIELTRPGKECGTSASIIVGAGGDPVLTVFSSNWPVLGVAEDDRDVAHWVLSGGELVHPRDAVGAAGPADKRRGTDPSTGEISVNLPDEFWNARSQLRHVRQAAHARTLPADAVFGAVLARVATMVPPEHVLPAIIGGPGTFDIIVGLIGRSGAGKSSANTVARSLLPTSRTDIVDGLVVGSGEGIAQAYLGPVDETYEDSGGKQRKRSVTRQVNTAVLAYVDEGQVLTELGKRNGSTLLTTLRTAWTGGHLGQANASAETRRRVEAGRYRFAAVISWQPRHAAAIIDDAAGGTPQRIVWLPAADPAVPDVPPPWPGVLGWSPPATITAGHELAVDDGVAAEIRAGALARVRGEALDDELDAHGDLVRLKVAGLLAVLDDRDDVTAEDWRLAGMVMATSGRVRAGVRAEADLDALHREQAATARAVRRDVALSDSAERRALVSAAKAIGNRAHRAGDATVTRRELTQAIRGSQRRLVGLDEVIAHALGQDWIAEVDGGYRKGGSKPS